mmetsp:Transcript_6312/g.27798  ORF Transcript_6312/g.27798 Transcript_6312/m.27798 type:complete len:208 (+) Transcript_6312:2246-2869(+)
MRVRASGRDHGRRRRGGRRGTQRAPRELELFVRRELDGVEREVPEEERSEPREEPRGEAALLRHDVAQRGARAGELPGLHARLDDLRGHAHERGGEARGGGGGEVRDDGATVVRGGAFAVAIAWGGQQRALRGLVHGEEERARRDDAHEVAAEAFVEVPPAHRRAPARRLQARLDRVDRVQRRLHRGAGDDAGRHVTGQLAGLHRAR